ncbi:hypothetical protein [Bradyrhizobium japonicum]|uniref:hypothetical protein n=1 Tax=Bradyrhizobium japonicum TaxID=375 RepID=UPI00200C3281|nr:hypothetical protein [Bradyrhizobium japonicum]UQD96080.1 hypothetical protein JEY30_31555 [Bradyrhizobium japonicum]
MSDDALDDLIQMVLVEQYEATQAGKLSHWTVYHRPGDWPDGYIARRFEVGGGTGVAVATKSNLAGGDSALSMLRQVFEAAGLVCLTRSPEDHESVVETWM